MAMRILVVDDSSVMRKMVIRAVQMSGLPISGVREAGDGIEALQVLETHSPDLILMDINMPRLDGMETLRRIRADVRLAGNAVIVVSTEGSEHRIAEVARLRAGFVRKPFSPETLVDAVIQAIGGAHVSNYEPPALGDDTNF